MKNYLDGTACKPQVVFQVFAFHIFSTPFNRFSGLGTLASSTPPHPLEALDNSLRSKTRKEESSVSGKM